MKRALSLLLAVLMVLSTGIFAFANEPNMEIQANGGEFRVTAAFDAVPWDTDGFARYFANGESFKDHGVSITDPVFWDSTRDFEGWQVLYKATLTDDYGNSWEQWVEIKEGDLLTTAEMLDYKKPSAYDNIMFRAKYEGNDSDWCSEVGFRVKGGTMQFDDGFNAPFTEVQISFNGKEGHTIGSEISTVTMSGFVQKNGYEFEGWLLRNEDTKEFVKDSNGNYKVYSTAEAFALPVPEYNSLFYAKWKELSVEAYLFLDSKNETQNMEISGFDSFFYADYALEDGSSWKTNGFGAEFKDGTSFKDLGYSVTDPVFWDANRKFDGWQAFHVYEVTKDGDTWFESEEIEEEPLDTDAMLAYKKPAAYGKIEFRAKFEGNDEDYYSYIGFNNFFGGFTLTHDDLEEYHQEGMGNRFREGSSIDAQTEKYDIVLENPNGYTFEGWFCVEDKTGAIFAEPGEEYHLYTFADIVSENVGKEDISYFAKWKELTLDECLGKNKGPEGPQGPDPESNVFFDCYGGIIVISDGQDSMETDLIDGYFKLGECLDDQNIYIVSGYPERFGHTFEGWFEFNMDTEEFVKDSNGGYKLYSNAEIIVKPHPDYKVCYLAKWKEIPFSQYVYGENHEDTSSGRNIGFYANGGRNEDILIDANGNRVGDSSLITQWSLPENETLTNTYIADGFSKVTFVPYKDGVKSESWTLVQADSIMWKEYILGTTFTPSANQTVLYEEVLGAYQRYLVAENAKTVSTKMLTDDIFEIADTKSYFAIANWGKVSDVEVEGSNGNHIIVEDDLVKVPESLENKFESVEEIEKEIEKELEKNGNKKPESKIIYMEISLMVEDSQGKFVPVENADIKGKKIEVTIDYPEGINVTNAHKYEFVVAHLKSDGTVELIKPVANSKGLVFKVDSFSPFALLYSPAPADDTKEEIKVPTDIIVIGKRDEEEEANPNTGAPVFGI